MAWNDQNEPNNPWGNRPNQQQPDLEEVVKRLQEKFSKIFGGGSGGGAGSPGELGKGAIIGGLVVLLLLWFGSGVYVVAADEEAVVLRFGQHIATKGPGLNWHLPYPVESVEKVPVTRVQRLEIGFRTIADGQNRKISQEALMLTATRISWRFPSRCNTRSRARATICSALLILRPRCVMPLNQLFVK